MNIPSFNVLIATIGRPTLQHQLDSLLSQLLENDILTLVFDGYTAPPTTFDLSKAKCRVDQYAEPEALKFWGHGVRNKYATLLRETDFVLHGDDDDRYTDYAFNVLRKICTNTSKLYIAKILGNDRKVLPRSKLIQVGNIGTPCGIIPYKLNKEGMWSLTYGGDGIFYKEISMKALEIEYIDNVIYIVRP